MHEKNKINFSTLGICVLFLAIALSPRIPLPFYIPNRAFDIRIEDLVILLFCWGGILYLLIRGTDLSIPSIPLIKPIGVYFFVGILLTCIASLSYETDVFRAIFYPLKELEFFVIFLLVAVCINTEAALRKIYKIIFFAGLINGIWAVYQMLTGESNLLFYVPASDVGFVYSKRLAHYGITMIGEAGAFPVCAFYAFISYFLYSHYLIKPSSSKLFLSMGVFCSVLSVLSGEKIAFVFMGVFIFVTIFLFTSYKNSNTIARGNLKIIWKVLIGIMLCVFVIFISRDYVVKVYPYTERAFHIFEEGTIQRSFAVRAEVWGRILSIGFDNFLTGIGKGTLYVFPDGSSGEESHNYYIKVFVGSGIFGFAVFIWLLFRIKKFLGYVYKDSVFDSTKIIAHTTFCVFIALAVASTVQDAFKTVIPNEVFWFFLGLTVAAYRIEKNIRAAQSNPLILKPEACPKNMTVTKKCENEIPAF